MAHIATFDCLGLNPHLPESMKSAGFPSDGHLSFFYFDGQVDGGVEVVSTLFGTEGGARVIYTPPNTELIPTEPPSPIVSYRGVELRAEPCLTWPTWEHPDVYDGAKPAEGWGPLFEVLDGVGRGAPGPLHQVGGHPDPVQGPVEVEIAYGQLSAGGRRKIDRRDPAVVEASRNWLLLAQFDTDDRAGFTWGDGGVLYFMIRPEDLALAKFDAAAFTWQCG